jgi:hypothetical protein
VILGFLVLLIGSLTPPAPPDDSSEETQDTATAVRVLEDGLPPGMTRAGPGKPIELLQPASSKPGRVASFTGKVIKVGHRPPQLVGLRAAETCHIHRHPQDLFLKQRHPERPLERRLAGRVDVVDRLPAAPSVQVALVRDDRFGLHSREEIRSAGDVSRLTRSEKEPQRTPLTIGHQMDLGGQSSSGTPHSLVGAPPFPVTACWWAFTMLESSIR